MKVFKVKFDYKEDNKWGLMLENKVEMNDEYLNKVVNKELEYLLDYVCEYIFGVCEGDWGVYNEGDEIKYEMDMDLWYLWENDVNMNLMMGGLRNNNLNLEDEFKIKFDNDEWEIKGIKNKLGNLEKFIVKMIYKKS